VFLTPAQLEHGQIKIGHPEKRAEPWSGEIDGVFGRGGIVSADIAADVAAEVSKGTAIEISIAGYPGEVFHGDVLGVSPGRPMPKLRARVRVEGRRLREGVPARVRYAIARPPRLTIDRTAVVREDGQSFVFAVREVDAKGRVWLERRVVETLEREDPFVVVASGVVEGEALVLDGAVLVAELFDRLSPG
jgi:hypothetical protein